ncbi:RNA polymerase II transcription elongation factor SpEAF [Ascochyta rabiei]|uniref:Vacuolar import and degradation protein 21 n=1 Tax=Didymella rabiei TaxID=5454 RepID=A0A163D9C7_DIDRA|nr:RNA polymerase II transcription elongation factor SpEAF [Ascochyta rabiei]KZM23006.1 chromatin binding [Ascochyta rabiei]UPX17912.1 RNA polymerase II transcription elongation factor SpEAF [Ascochyta rabiei]
MSLDGHRDALLREKRNESVTCNESRKRKLRELYKYTVYLEVPDKWATNTQLDQLEGRFLDENDIEKGRRFNDATTLPFPHSGQQPTLPSTLPFAHPGKPVFSPFAGSSPSPLTGASLEEQLRAASASPSVVSQPLPPSDALTHSDEHRTSRPSSIAPPAGTPSPSQASFAEERVSSKASTTAQPITEVPGVQEVGVGSLVDREDPSVDPKSVADSAVGDQDASTIPAVNEKPRTPKVVHLPSKETQESRLQETERKLDHVANKERREDERFTLPQSNGPTEMVSSPSSTVGPYSQATPHAPHHSPDTSPDTEAFHDTTHPLESNEDILDPAAQQVKEDHERALQKQMKEARERARRPDSPTSDVEKQIEDEQAIRLARDGKSRLGESTDNTGHSLTQEAEQVISESDVAQSTKEQPEHTADSLPTPTTTAPEPSVLDREATETVMAQSKENPAADHPTPPADIDLDMTQAPAMAQEEATLAQTSPRCERMTTRVSSGAIRQRSVSEIISEHAAQKTFLTPQSSNLSSPQRPRHQDRKSMEVSTVVFAKKNPVKSYKTTQTYDQDYASLQGASEDSSRDYLEGLFKFQAHHPPRSVPLQELVASARKTVSTAGTLAMIRENQDYKILKRVYQLQNANRWSLRQLQKSAEPERPFTHQDLLLLEMKWMQTDFKEERKWKHALAATLADWCAEYVHSSPEERIALRVKTSIPKSILESTNDNDMHDAPTPDLVPSGAHETESESYADEDELLTPFHADPPAGVFSLGYNDVVIKIDRTPASDHMFRELPFYEPMLEGASDVTPFSISEPPILPVSKFVTGKLVSQIRGPPRKRSRYDYDSEDEPSTPPSRAGTSAEHSMPSTPGRRLFCRNDLPPEMTDVALFNAENKHVRDRLQAAHQFRPPTEFNMPSVAFFENRTPSQWLWEEDQKLRALVKEYTFNWSLVAQQLALPSKFTSGSGRRTPWECFERWVQLEGLPAEMSKTQYFRTYQGRLEQANKVVFAQYQAQQQQQQQQSGGQTPGQPRRRPTTTPIRVERRRENRHLAIIDGMRKLARKRESVAHKQAESQKAAALRKAHEPAPPKNNVHTPQEFSRLKWEREERLKQKQLQQEIAVRNQMAVQRQAQHNAQNGVPNGVPQMQRNGTPGGANSNMPAQMANNPSQQAQNAAAMAARAQQSQQGMPNNLGNANMTGMSMGTPGVPQAQMQSNMQNGQRMGPPDQMRMAMQRNQFNSPNQQQFHLQQQQQQMSMANAQGMNMNGIPNANMMASMSNQNLNGNMNASMNGMPNGASSPRVNQAAPNMQRPNGANAGGHVPQYLQLQNTIKMQHPDWTPEQVQKSASDQLQRYMAKQRVQAMNAAAGSPGISSPSPQMANQFMQQNGGMANSPPVNAVQNYQQQLVQQQRLMSQQRQPQQAGSPGMNGRPPSRSATPQNPQQMQQSPGLVQAQPNRPT